MVETKCGFNDGPQNSGSDLLVFIGPTLKVGIGFDPNFKLVQGKPPKTGLNNMDALVDTGAGVSCIDNIVAAALRLPVVDRQPVSGSNGRHMSNVYQAQVYIPSLNYVFYGRFAGVDLIAGGQSHQALLGRDFLKDFKLTYEGNSGTVTISSI